MIKVGDMVRYQTQYGMPEEETGRVKELRLKQRYVVVDDRGWDRVVLLDRDWIRGLDGKPIEKERQAMAGTETKTEDGRTEGQSAHLMGQKVCRLCGKDYKPRSNAQFYCEPCGAEHPAKMRKKWKMGSGKKSGPVPAKAPVAVKPVVVVDEHPVALTPPPAQGGGLLAALWELNSVARNLMDTLRGGQ